MGSYMEDFEEVLTRLQQRLGELEEVSDEVFARRAAARQRQITIGKSRPEYKLYANAIPYHQRSEHMPHSPDPYARISKRAFDRELAKWRRGLHVCSAQLEGNAGGSEPKALPAGAGLEPGEGWRGAPPPAEEWSPSKVWSPAGTESTRADSEASTPAHGQCRAMGPPGPAGAQPWSNVKLNLFEHLSGPLPQQAVLLPETQPAWDGSAASAVPQMLPAAPQPGAWEPYPAGLGSAVPMQGVLPGAGTASSGPAPYPDADRQCTYACVPQVSAWGEQQAAPLWMLGQQAAAAPYAQQPGPPLIMGDAFGRPQEAPTAPHPPAPQLWQAPGTPRSGMGRAEAPSTPLTRIVHSVASPAAPSPWQRTPSPDHGRYNNVDLWATAPMMVVTRSYVGESVGTLSVEGGSHVRAMMENPRCGDSKCAWPAYVYCCQGAVAGWVPQRILWRCYKDHNGRRWACDDATGTWCWEDELERARQGA